MSFTEYVALLIVTFGTVGVISVVMFYYLIKWQDKKQKKKKLQNY